MGSAPVSQSLMQAIHATLPRASVTNAYGTTEAGPVVFGPHPQGLPQPEMSVGYPHPKVEVRLVDGADRNADAGRAGMRCPAVMNGYHNRPALKPPFTTTDSTSPATCSGVTATASTISSAAPTTCSSPAARTSIRPTSSACWSAMPMSRRPRWCRSTTTSRARSLSPSWCRNRAARPAKTRSSSSRSPTRRPTRIRASSGSSTSCRSPRPTRSTATCCTRWRRRMLAAPAG